MGAGQASVGGGPEGEFAQDAATIAHESADSPTSIRARIGLALVETDTNLAAQAAAVGRGRVGF